MDTSRKKYNAQNTNNRIFYWMTSFLLIALILVAFSIWGPVTPPEDIMPAAGSPAYIDETSPAVNPVLDRGTLGDAIKAPTSE